MHSQKTQSVISAIVITAALMTGAAATGRAQQAAVPDKPTSIVPLAGSSQLVSLLPDSLAGVRATNELKQVAKENLSELVGDKAQSYREYRVTSAVSREYGRIRVDVFETQNQLAAFGLLTFNRGSENNDAVEEDVGSGGLRLRDQLAFFKGRFLVRISEGANNVRGGGHLYESFARAIAAEIMPASTAITRAALLDSLPAASILNRSERYFLGPESLNTYVEHARDMFDFNGDTEAVAAQYAPQGDSHTPDQSGPNLVRSSDLLTLAIVEYHTPQFATDAMTRASDYVSSLPESEQQKLIVKRVGNYILEASNVRDRAFAENLMNSVQYPYTVKWLRNPLWPTNDPFRAQKAAQMLLSTFGLLGLILMTVLFVGTVFGTTVFLKRRKRQQEVFSDAGGMLRLDIDQFETAMLGLPPAREE